MPGLAEQARAGGELHEACERRGLALGRKMDAAAIIEIERPAALANALGNAHTRSKRRMFAECGEECSCGFRGAGARNPRQRRHGCRGHARKFAPLSIDKARAFVRQPDSDGHALADVHFDRIRQNTCDRCPAHPRKGLDTTARGLRAETEQ